MSRAASESNARGLTRWIMAAVLLWGLFLAAGAYRVGGDYAVLRAATIAACTVAFLAFWWTALALRGRHS
jgi:hypothetical protein